MVNFSTAFTSTQRENNTKQLECYKCGKFGHKARDCRSTQRTVFNNKPRVDSRQQGPTTAIKKTSDETAQKKTVTCYICNKTGHYASNCPERKTKEARTANIQETTESTNSPEVRVATSVIENSSNNQMVTHSNEKKNEFSKIQRKNSKKEEMEEPSNKKYVRTPCLLQGHKIFGLVDAGATHSFIDYEWAKSHDLTIILVKEGKIVQCMDGSEIPRIGVVKQAKLENGTNSILVDLEVAKLSGGEKLILGLDLFKPLNYQLLNVPFTWPQSIQSPPTIPKAITQLPNDGKIPTDGIVSEWKESIERNQALGPKSVCNLPNSELAIETGDAKPIWTRQYPIPEALMERVTQRVKEWEDNGWITNAPSTCKWNSPLLAAKKPSKDGGPDDIRVCLDARKLNDVITNIPDSNLPGIREVIDRIGEFEWITILDLADSYQQHKIRPEDREKTAFMINGVQKMFVTVPYGLKIMTGHMQTLMEKLLGPLNCQPFQDDVVLADKNTETHINKVKQVLNTLTNAGLRLKIKKCKFFKKEARVLGFLITQEGIKMDPLKIKAINEWPQPKDAKGMQRFMGAANFNREFSADFAKAAAPLDECRNVRGPINWNSERIKAFEEVKQIFSQNICLQHIDWKKTMYLTTDACGVGIGAWIGQKNNKGEITPVICVSKKLDTTQQRWSATKKELWGLMWAMKRLRHYLLGRKFIARVDHRPLVSMLKSKLNLMMEGWIDMILQFDFITEYLPGEKNILADALSRSYENTTVKEVRMIAMNEEEQQEINAKLMWEAEKRGMKILNETERIELVAKAHALGHFGVESMHTELLKQHYWWPKMRESLQETVQSCIACMRFNASETGYHPLQSIVAEKPWDHVEIDLIGPVPTSIEGYNNILVMVDVMTGYTVLRPLKQDNGRSCKSSMECDDRIWANENTAI